MQSLKAIFFVAFLFSVASCKKDSNNVVKSKTDLLTSKTWVYDEYFTNYNQTNTQVAYKRGKLNNSMDLSANKIQFKADGTYQETTETGATLNGTWKFLNNETQTEVKNSLGTYTSNVILLTETNYVWYDQTSGRYGKMTPL